MKKTIVIALTLITTGSIGCASVETPKYKSIIVDGDFEIRDYSTVIVAETIVTGDFSEAGNRGFRPLADYIFGANTTRSEIAMTAPVTLSDTDEDESEEIAMTAPVGQSVTNEGYVVSFTMPETYTLDSLPQPKNPAVKLREIPAHRSAVITFSGTWSESRYQKKLIALQQWISQLSLSTTGKPVFARYNPPWTPWFLRRNEILLEVEPGDDPQK